VPGGAGLRPPAAARGRGGGVAPGSAGWGRASGGEAPAGGRQGGRGDAGGGKGRLNFLYSRVAIAIRKQIRDELHLTASAGVAPSKFLAKIASDRATSNKRCEKQKNEPFIFSERREAA